MGKAFTIGFERFFLEVTSHCSGSVRLYLQYEQQYFKLNAHNNNIKQT